MQRRALSSSAELPCPFCGEVTSVPIDEGGGEHQIYVEDCPTCCKPRVVHVGTADSGELEVWCERSP
jgi:Cysteine-rich CPXCG